MSVSQSMSTISSWVSTEYPNAGGACASISTHRTAARMDLIFMKQNAPLSSGAHYSDTLTVSRVAPEMRGARGFRLSGAFACYLFSFMHTAREQLLQFLAEKSFHLGEFKLASGLTSDYYIDCRATTLHGEGARLVGRVFYEEIYNSGARPEALGGLTLGADPIVTAVAMLSAQRIQGRADERPGHVGSFFRLDGFLVRKAEKTHGMQQRVEGFRKKGAKV